jgi:hypothetical protein
VAALFEDDDLGGPDAVGDGLGGLDRARSIVPR